MSSGTNWALIDQTGGAQTSDGDSLDPAGTKLTILAKLLTIYSNRDVSAEYGGNHLVRAASGPNDIRTGEIPFTILPTLDNAPGAIAYHDVDNQGSPDAFDAITLSDSLMGPGNSLLVALSHEIAETIGDPGANLLASDGTGKGYAREACDPVEQNSYPITMAPGTTETTPTTGYVSDFVLGSYFVPGHPGPYNWMASKGMIGQTNPPGPLEVAPAGGGNYQITYSSVGGQGQVTGSISAKRQAKKSHPTSRTSRRGVRA